MYYDDDFYNEPSEFEIKMGELKESIAKSVKEEFVEEMERLRIENKNLQEIKEHFEQVKKDYERKKQECDRKIFEAEQSAKRMRAEEIMERYKIFLWNPRVNYLYGPKCSKCDKDRKLEITLPSGRKIKDACKCSNTGMEVMRPMRMVMYEIAERNRDIAAWYKPCGKKGDRYYTLDYVPSVYLEKTIVPGTSFDEVERIKNQREVLFTTEEECREYCEYVNEKKPVPYDTIYNLDGSVYKVVCK